MFKKISALVLAVLLAIGLFFAGYQYRDKQSTSDQANADLTVATTSSPEPQDGTEKKEAKKQRDAEIVTHLTADGYATQHGDHQHFHYGIPTEDVKFLPNLILPENYDYSEKDVVGERDNFRIVKTEDGYRVALKNPQLYLAYVGKLKNNTTEYNPAQKDILHRGKQGSIAKYNGVRLFIPKNASANSPQVIAKQQQELKANNSVNSSDMAHNLTNDGYKFSPKDIVSEDAEGYVVRHGDHFHYIFKKDLALSNITTDNQGSKPAPADTADKPTAQPVVDIQPNQPGNQPQPGGNQANPADGDSNTPAVDSSVTSQGLKAGSDILSPADLAKVKYFAKQKGLSLRELTARSGMLIWPHGDHYHANEIAGLPSAPAVDNVNEPTVPTKPDPNSPPAKPVDGKTTEQGLKAGSDTLNSDDLKRAKWIAKNTGNKLEDIYVKDGVAYWPQYGKTYDIRLASITLEADYDPDKPSVSKDEVTSQGLKAGSDHLSDNDLAKVKKFAASMDLKLEQLLVKDGVIHWPHGDHYHVQYLSDLYTDEDLANDPVTDQGLKEGSDHLDEMDLKRVQEISRQTGMPLSRIFVKDGVAYWPQGDRQRKISISDVVLLEEIPSTTEVNKQGLKAGSDELDDKLLARVKYISNVLEIPLKDLYVKDGRVIWSHGDHAHAFTLNTMVLPEELPITDEVNDQGLRATSDHLSDTDLAKAKWVANRSRNKLSDIYVIDGIAYYPVAKHFGLIELSSIKFDDKPAETESPKKTDAELEAEFEVELKKIARQHNVDPSAIEIVDGKFIVPHGDHTHEYPIKSEGWKIYLANKIKPIEVPNISGSADYSKVEAEANRIKDDARYYLHDNPRQYARVVEAIDNLLAQAAWNTSSTEAFISALKKFESEYLTKNGTVKLDKSVEPLPIDSGKGQQSDIERLEAKINEIAKYYNKKQDVNILSLSSSLRQRLHSEGVDLNTLEKEIDEALAKLAEEYSEETTEDNPEAEKIKALKEKASELQKQINQELAPFKVYYDFTVRLNQAETAAQLEQIIADIEAYFAEHPDHRIQ